MHFPAEPELTSDQRLALTLGVTQFNRGLYFECHDTLEELWSGFRGPSRDFFQGLIQVSVGFHHLERGNRAGALKTFTRALGRLESYRACYLGFDLAAQRVQLRAVLAALTSEEVGASRPPPVWRFDNLPAAEQGEAREANGPKSSRRSIDPT